MTIQQRQAKQAMGAAMTWNNSYLIIFLCTWSLVLNFGKSEVILVGGQDYRWTDSFPGGYFSWAQQFKFVVGDVLEFKYSKLRHNVYDVTKASFGTCDNSTGINAIYESGDDRVELKEAKQYWFICTLQGHCQNGMKFTVNVSEAAATGTSQNEELPSQPPDNANSVSRKHISARIYLLVAAILSMLVL